MVAGRSLDSVCSSRFRPAAKGRPFRSQHRRLTSLCGSAHFPVRLSFPQSNRVARRPHKLGFGVLVWIRSSAKDLVDRDLTTSGAGLSWPNSKPSRRTEPIRRGSLRLVWKKKKNFRKRPMFAWVSISSHLLPRPCRSSSLSPAFERNESRMVAQRSLYYV